MEQGRLLLELQNYLQEKYALQKNSRLMDMAQRLRELQNTIGRADTEQEKLKAQAAEAENMAQQIEQQAAKLTEQIKTGKDRLYGAKGSGLKELLSLQQSLQKLEEEAEKGEARYWEMLRQAEAYKNKQKEIREMVKALKAEYNQGVREYKEEKNLTELKIAAVESKEEELLSRLSPEVIKIFRAAEKKYPVNPVALFRGGNCSGCHISIPTYLAKQIKEGKKICYCDNCGRILIH